jgi:hypothetical protein
MPYVDHASLLHTVVKSAPHPTLRVILEIERQRGQYGSLIAVHDLDFRSQPGR